MADEPIPSAGFGAEFCIGLVWAGVQVLFSLIIFQHINTSSVLSYHQRFHAVHSSYSRSQGHVSCTLFKYNSYPRFPRSLIVYISIHYVSVPGVRSITTGTPSQVHLRLIPSDARPASYISKFHRTRPHSSIPVTSITPGPDNKQNKETKGRRDNFKQCAASVDETDIRAPVRRKRVLWRA